jgi:phosphomethylpyrimidine synthase
LDNANVGRSLKLKRICFKREIPSGVSRFLVFEQPPKGKGENMTHTTQRNAARQGIVTKEIKAVAEYEQMSEAELLELVAKGQVAIPANKNHKCLKPYGIGNKLKTKINVNLGTSKDCLDMEVELAKVMESVKMGAESIMDLSSFGDTRTFRKKLTAECPAIIGTVPIYDAVVYYNKPLKEITAKEWIDIVKMHAEDGVDFMTIHCGINKLTANRFKAAKRHTNIVSRGGSIIFAWMELTGNENPFYEYYDEILEICQQYDVTLSLGDACRPGSLEDAGDISQIEELVTLGELTMRAWDKDVQIIIEGPGHMPLNQIQANMEIQQTICKGAPFYVLGPLVTDVAPGYDHITAAIGGAIAATYGASFLCYVTPAEHLRLPTLEDVKEGIMASKIAAHAADVAKGIKGAKDWDYKMSEARRELDWEKQFELAMDGGKARRYREESTPEKEDTCTMCGKMCAMRNVNKILRGENVDIMD